MSSTLVKGIKKLLLGDNDDYVLIKYQILGTKINKSID